MIYFRFPSNIIFKYIIKRMDDVTDIEDCFKILKVTNRDNQTVKCYVPTCVQFKIKKFTDINFQNLSAVVNGVLCINFLIFTTNQHLRNCLVDRLYWNQEEKQILNINRQKKIERDGNFIPVMLNKDVHIKLPTTRTKQFQIQGYKSPIYYRKKGVNVQGIRIFYVIRKQFKVEILKNSFGEQFFAPFNFINLDFNISMQQMMVKQFEFKSEGNQKRQSNYMKHIDFNQIGFNILRIQEPFLKEMSIDQKVDKMCPMIAYSSQDSFGKYDLVETQLKAYSHDERNLVLNHQGNATGQKLLFQDPNPYQISFKPFKYAVFKIPLYRFPVVDMMTIFIPLWLLSFFSIYVYFQTTQILNRIVNVAALMISYAAIQPIVRQNIPEATSLTLVDLLIYMQLFINILYLARSIDVRVLYDNPDGTPYQNQHSNDSYDRLSDSLVIISIVISALNVIIILLQVARYMRNKESYKGKNLPRKVFRIDDNENWTLTLLMDRAFGRYKQTLQFVN